MSERRCILRSKSSAARAEAMPRSKVRPCLFFLLLAALRSSCALVDPAPRELLARWDGRQDRAGLAKRQPLLGRELSGPRRPGTASTAAAGRVLRREGALRVAVLLLPATEAKKVQSCAERDASDFSPVLHRSKAFIYLFHWNPNLPVHLEVASASIL